MKSVFILYLSSVIFFSGCISDQKRVGWTPISDIGLSNSRIRGSQIISKADIDAIVSLLRNTKPKEKFIMELYIFSQDSVRVSTATAPDSSAGDIVNFSRDSDGWKVDSDDEDHFWEI